MRDQFVEIYPHVPRFLNHIYDTSNPIGEVPLNNFVNIPFTTTIHFVQLRIMQQLTSMLPFVPAFVNPLSENKICCKIYTLYYTFEHVIHYMLENRYTCRSHHFCRNNLLYHFGLELLSAARTKHHCRSKSCVYLTAFRADCLDTTVKIRKRKN